VALLQDLDASNEKSPSVGLAEPADSRARTVKSERFVFIDALRGIAALWVLCHHAYYGKHLDLVTPKMPSWVVTFFKSGHYGVPIFFVLSGFVIAYSVSRYRVDLPFFGRFVVRRSIRLDPPYWVALALALLLRYISHLAVPTKPYEQPEVGQILAHLVYLQEILGYPELNGVFWTLSYEIQFYLVFCLLMVVVHATRRDENDSRSLFFIFGPALLVAAAWPLEVIKGGVWPGVFLPLWHGFLLGMLACWSMIGTVRPGWFYFYAAILGIGGCWNLNEFTVVCVLTSTLLLVAANRKALGRWLGWRWLQFLGLISYSLYLIHNPISGAFYNIAYRITGRSWATEIFWFVPMIAVNIACAWAIWWLVERPSLALAHRFKLRRE
jgi:peptidoglycan/LPS O-acetylase OafA/YrhL